MTNRRATLTYALASAGAIALGAAALSFYYSGAADRRAIWVSAAVAFVVQQLAFAVARLLARSQQGIAGWGLGAVICIVTLVVYGFVAPGFGLPSGAALVSLATFFFVTELIEPPLLAT